MIPPYFFSPQLKINMYSSVSVVLLIAISYPICFTFGHDSAAFLQATSFGKPSIP